MKTRSDFVSNSSSCSFVINDIKSFNDVLTRLSSDKNGVDTWWLSGLNLSFEFKNTPQNKLAFKKFLDYYSDRQDSTLYVSGSFEYFFSIDPQFYSQMENVSVYAYDDCGNADIEKLILMYFAMKSEGVDVDNSSTEHEFSLFNDVPGGIVNAAMKMFHPKTRELNCHED